MTKWGIFVDWCAAREIDPLAPSVCKLADFFVHLFNEKKFATSTIKGYRAAIGGVFRSMKSPDLTSDPDIGRLFAGFSVQRPVTQKVFPKWSLSLVLAHLMEFPYEPLLKSSLKYLTHKTVVLLIFATAARRSEIHALSVEKGHIKYSMDGHTVYLRPGFGFVAKNQSQNEVRSPWVIRGLYDRVSGDLPDRTLCPIRALRLYLKTVSSFRRDRNRLFISYMKNKLGEISRATISRWLVETIQDAYRNAEGSESARKLAGVTAHQDRAMATSWSAFAGASPEEISHAAFWKGQSTFSSFYLRDLSLQEEEEIIKCVKLV